MDSIRSLVPEWIRTLTPYPPGMPIEELERELGIQGSIKLASNENPLGPSPRALAAVGAALGTLHRYPDGSAFYLKRRLAERLGASDIASFSPEGSATAGSVYLRSARGLQYAVRVGNVRLIDNVPLEETS